MLLSLFSMYMDHFLKFRQVRNTQQHRIIHSAWDWGWVSFGQNQKHVFNGEKAIYRLWTMRAAQNRSTRIKSPHFDTRIHVSTQIKTTPRGIKDTSFIGQQQQATLADNESRAARKHAGSHVCHHRIENLNHLGVPAKLKHTAPGLPLIKKRCPGEHWQRGLHSKRSPNEELMES